MHKYNQTLNNPISDYVSNSACLMRIHILQGTKHTCVTSNSLMLELMGGAKYLICSQTDRQTTQIAMIKYLLNKHFLSCLQTQTIEFGQKLWDIEPASERESERKLTTIYSDLFRFVGLFTGGWPPFFQALTG